MPVLAGTCGLGRFLQLDVELPNTNPGSEALHGGQAGRT